MTLYDFENLDAKISFDSFSMDLKASRLDVRKRGESIVHLEDIRTDVSGEDLGPLYGRLQYKEPFKISLVDTEGNKFYSKEASFIGYTSHTSYEGEYLKDIKVGIDDLEHKSSAGAPAEGIEGQKGLLSQYWTNGRSVLRRVDLNIPSIGNVWVHGYADASDFQEIVNIVSVSSDCDDVVDSDSWFCEADLVVKSLLDLMSIGLNNRTSWIVRKRFKDGIHLDGRYRASDFVLLGYETVHPMDMEPILSCLGAYMKFCKDPERARIIRSSLDLFLANHPHIESRFLSSFVALERISHLRMKDKRKSCGTKDQIRHLFDDYEVPVEDFEESLKKIFELRQRIFHASGEENLDEITRGLGIVREMFLRTLFSVVGFRGRYENPLFLEGDKDFPDGLPSIDSSLEKGASQ